MERLQHNFENMISRLDTNLFNAIHASLTEEDRRALLAIQLDTREAQKKYSYLEIGSYMGGSIQPHLIDPKCYRIYSIDKRVGDYTNNSTQTMMNSLKRLSEKDISKIVTFNNDASELQADNIKDKPDICFIDGWHTDEAVISDFNFAIQVIKSNGFIFFHDCYKVNKGLVAITKQLKKGIKFEGYKLFGNILIIGLGKSAFKNCQNVKKLCESSYDYYFFRVKTSSDSKKLNKYIRNFIKYALRSILSFIGKLTVYFR